MLHAAVGKQTHALDAVSVGGAMSGFDEHMSILEALARHPGARRVFEAHGMNCSLCLGASIETIEAGAVMHQVDPGQVVAELNALQHLEVGSL